MKKTIYLHIGLPKTGTTSIQKYMRLHESELGELGYLNPGMKVHKMFGAFAHHVPFLNAISDKILEPLPNTDLFSQKTAVETAFELVRSKAKLNAIIITHETLSMRVKKWDYDYFRKLTAGMDIRIILYSRFTDEWIESLYHQNIWARVHPKRAHLYERPLHDIEEGPSVRSMSQFSISGIVKHIRRELENATVIVRSYDLDRCEGVLISGFLSELAISPQASLTDTNSLRLNLGHPAAHTALLHLLQLNRLGLAKLKPIAAALSSRSERQICFEPLENRRFRFLSREIVLKARAQYRYDLHNFSQLPQQPAYAEDAEVSFLSTEDAIAMLDWLKPDISDELCTDASAACGG